MLHTAIKVLDSVHIDKFDLDVQNTVKMFKHEFHIIQSHESKSFQLTTMVYSFINQNVYEQDCCNNGNQIINDMTCCKSYECKSVSVNIEPSQFVQDPVTLFLAGLRAQYSNTEMIVA